MRVKIPRWPATVKYRDCFSVEVGIPEINNQVECTRLYMHSFIKLLEFLKGVFLCQI